MPNPFDITTATNIVTLDNNRQGIAVFTAVNKMRRHIHATAKMTTQPPEAAKWLTILPSEAGSTAPGDSREFPIGSTQQIQVRIAAPPDAPAGTYSMKLTLADDTNPDDNFTESPDVMFTVPAIVHPPPPKPFPVWIIPAVLIGVVIIVIIVIVATRNRTPPLPNLVAGNIVVNGEPVFCFQHYDVQFDVANLGTAPTTRGATVRLIEALASGQQLNVSDAMIPILQPGQTTSVTFMMVVQTASGQTHNLILTIDPVNEIPESNEGDNQNIYPLSVSGALLC